MDRLRSTELPPALIEAIEKRFIANHGPLNHLQQWCYQRDAIACGDVVCTIRYWLWWLSR